MRKHFNENDFEEIEGAMNKTAIFDALVYTGVAGKSSMTEEEYRTVLAKKKKMVRSDIKHQRGIDKYARKLDWNENENQ